MSVLRIHSLWDGIVLSCDLEHLFDLLGPRSIAASWAVADAYGESVETIGMSYGILESLG